MLLLPSHTVVLVWNSFEAPKRIRRATTEDIATRAYSLVDPQRAADAVNAIELGMGEAGKLLKKRRHVLKAPRDVPPDTTHSCPVASKVAHCATAL